MWFLLTFWAHARRLWRRDPTRRMASFMFPCASKLQPPDMLTYEDIFGPILSSTTPRFLLVSESPMQLSEHLSRHEQGMSILRCLLAASRVLNHSCPEDTRVQRVVRGVYAFVLYAADFWLDGLLYEFDASNQAGSATVEEFLMVSSDLATALGCSSSAIPDTAGPLQSSLFGSLLGAVQKYGPALFHD
jgi:hypothetical protein